LAGSAHEALISFWVKSISPQRVGSRKSIFQHIDHFQYNYYRYWGNGKFIDNFWLIDLPFVILFGKFFGS